METLINKCNRVPDFIPNLFYYFESRGRSNHLLCWAISKDLQKESNPHELFRGDTLATRLLFVAFFGDLGKRYLNLLFEDFINKLLLIPDLLVYLTR